MGRRGGGSLRHLAAGSLVLAVVAACYAPTEIDATLATDVGCDVVRTRGVVIRTAGSAGELPTVAPVTESTECNAGDLGTLTLVPGGGDEVVLEVILGVTRPTSECRPPTQVDGCIVARRRLGFVTHQALKLPIALERSCLGVPCGEDETCDRAACVPARVQRCPDGVCSVGETPSGGSGAPPPTPGVDASAPPTDAAAPLDSGSGPTDSGSTSALDASTSRVWCSVDCTWFGTLAACQSTCSDKSTCVVLRGGQVPACP